MYENETIQFLNSLNRFGWKLGLDTIQSFLHVLGDPNLKFKSVHIAGTNGKGSTAAMIESIMRKAGYKTGMFTSPHLVTLTERIMINGLPIPWHELQSLVKKYKSDIEKLGCTYFETLTGLAFKYFADRSVDIAIVEVGLGGRLDATNILFPELSVITQIDYDHTEHLGTSPIQIAKEKGGIIKYNVPCITIGNSGVKHVLDQIAREKKAPFYDLDNDCLIQAVEFDEQYTIFNLEVFNHQFKNLRLNLAGKHQLQNAALAVGTVLLLKQKGWQVSGDAIYSGLADVNWPGRLQIFQSNPKVVLDVAHNVGAIHQVMNNLHEIFNFKKLFVVIGLLKDKDYRGIARIVTSKADFVHVVSIKSERALPPEILAQEIAKNTDNYNIRRDILQAFEEIQKSATKDDLILITGSHYTVGEFLQYFCKIPQNA